MLTDSRNRVMAPNKGHTIEYTQKVWARLEAAVDKALKKGANDKGVEDAITKALEDIGKIISKGLDQL